MICLFRLLIMCQCFPDVDLTHSSTNISTLHQGQKYWNPFLTAVSMQVLPIVGIYESIYATLVPCLQFFVQFKFHNCVTFLDMFLHKEQQLSI